MSIFDKRINYKPFEYPEIFKFTEAINRSFWVHSEVDFTADIQDFHSHLSEAEKQVIKRSLLAIAQIEVNVKTFWGDLYRHLPKPEFNVSLDILKLIPVSLMYWVIGMSLRVYYKLL
jgi:ribonucleoside-diphosphate reductase beta chain